MNQSTEVLKADFNDWLIVYCFLSRSRIFHSYEESQIPTKGRPKINLNHLLFRHTHLILQALVTTKKRRSKIFSICHPQAGFLFYMIISFLNALSKTLITI